MFYGCTYKQKDADGKVLKYDNGTEFPKIIGKVFLWANATEGNATTCGEESEFDTANLFDIPKPLRKTEADEYYVKSVLNESEEGLENMGPI